MEPSLVHTVFNLPAIHGPGPPGPPDKVSVEEITDSTAQLSWSPGRDNGSPIIGYIIQARTPFTVGWQAVDTGSVDTFSCCAFFIIHTCLFIKKHGNKILGPLSLFFIFPRRGLLQDLTMCRLLILLCSPRGDQRQHADSHSLRFECLGGV